MDIQSLGRIKHIAQKNRKNIRKSYLVKGRRRTRPLQFLRPELHSYAYQTEGIGDGAPTVVVSITNAGGAPSDNTVVKLFLPNGRIVKKRTSVQSGQTKTVAFEWSGSPLPADTVRPYHLLCFDPLNDPIGSGLATQAMPKKRNYVRGTFPDRPPLSLQIIDNARLKEYLLDKYRGHAFNTVSLRSAINKIVNPGIPAQVSEALPWLEEKIDSWQWNVPLSFHQFFDWIEIRSQYEYYSDLQGWTARAPSANGFTAIDSPNGWRAQADEELSGVCIATTGLTQTTSELHQIVTMNSQTIGTTARTLLGQGDLLASLSATVKVNTSAIMATLGLDCLDNAGAVLTTVRTSSPPASGQWHRVAASFALPPNTVRVRLRLMFDKSGAPAVGHNAIFGDLSLTFTHRQVYYGNLRA